MGALSIQAAAQVEELQELWAAVIPTEQPSTAQWTIWLTLHGADVIRTAIAQTATKALRLDGQMTTDHALRFTSAVANRLTKERTEQ